MHRPETLLLTIAPPFTEAGKRLLEWWPDGTRRVEISDVRKSGLEDGSIELSITFKLGRISG